jgi:hypothetical protein
MKRRLDNSAVVGAFQVSKLQPLFCPFLDLKSLVAFGSTSSGLFVSIIENETMWKDLHAKYWGESCITKNRLPFRIKFRAISRRSQNLSSQRNFEYQEHVRLLLASIKWISVKLLVGEQVFEVHTKLASIHPLQQGCMVQLNNLPVEALAPTEYEAHQVSLDQLYLGYQSSAISLLSRELDDVWNSCVVSVKWRCIRIFIHAEAISNALLNASKSASITYDPNFQLLQRPHRSLSYPPLASCLDHLTMVIEFCIGGTADAATGPTPVVTDEWVLHGGMGLELIQPQISGEDEWMRWCWYYNDVPCPAVLKRETHEDHEQNWQVGSPCFCLGTLFWANHFPLATLSLPAQNVGPTNCRNEASFGNVAGSNCTFTVNAGSVGDGYSAYTFALSLSRSCFGRMVGRDVSALEIQHAKALEELNRTRSKRGRRHWGS